MIRESHISTPRFSPLLSFFHNLGRMFVIFTYPIPFCCQLGKLNYKHHTWLGNKTLKIEKERKLQCFLFIRLAKFLIILFCAPNVPQEVKCNTIRGGDILNSNGNAILLILILCITSFRNNIHSLMVIIAQETAKTMDFK